MSISLELLSWDVVQADCLEYANRYVDSDFDAILTDYRLPDGFGTDLCSSFDIPVILCSAQMPEVEHPKHVGLIKKPFNPSSLGHQISQILEQNLLKEKRA